MFFFYVFAAFDRLFVSVRLSSSPDVNTKNGATVPPAELDRKVFHLLSHLSCHTWIFVGLIVKKIHTYVYLSIYPSVSCQNFNADRKSQLGLEAILGYRMPACSTFITSLPLKKARSIGAPVVLRATGPLV